MKRGIIASTGKMEKLKGGQVKISHNLSPSDINYYLLYWDKVILPTNNMFHYKIKEESELLATGIIERPMVNFESWSSNSDDNSYDLFVIAQSVVAKKLIEEDNSADWVVHQMGDQIVIGNGYINEFNSIKLDFVNCLPVPIDEINFQDILEFKEKRKDEFEELHSSLDRLYIDVLNSPDKAFVKRKSISELTKAIKNLESSSKERFKLLSKYSITAELNINAKDVILGLSAGAAFSHYSNFIEIPIASILSGVLSVLIVNLNKTISVESANNKLVLNYLVKASKKGIVK